MFDWEELSQTVDKSEEGRSRQRRSAIRGCSGGTGQPAAAPATNWGGGKEGKWIPRLLAKGL